MLVKDIEAKIKSFAITNRRSATLVVLNPIDFDFFRVDYTERWHCEYNDVWHVMMARVICSVQVARGEVLIA